MHLEVVTPRGRLVSVEVTEVTVPGVKGEFGVLTGHVPMLSGVKPGVLTYTGDAGSGRLALGAGYAEVSHDRINVLIETAERAADINVGEAQSNLVEAQKKLEHWESDDVSARAHVQNQRDWAQARLDAAGAADSAVH